MKPLLLLFSINWLLLRVAIVIKNVYSHWFSIERYADLLLSSSNYANDKCQVEHSKKCTNKPT